jgi:hypothetical protein
MSILLFIVREFKRDLFFIEPPTEKTKENESHIAA